MQPEAVKQLIERNLPGCEALVVSPDGSHFDVTVVGELFEGKIRLARERLVNGALGDAFATGAIHAINMKCYTPAEWATARKLQPR
jgi:acid stress-induced BolA-like protein IbaG/YrbA